jgi:hypothetical protein
MKSDPSLEVSTRRHAHLPADRHDPPADYRLWVSLGGPPTKAEFAGGGLRRTVLNPQDLP